MTNTLSLPTLAPDPEAHARGYAAAEAIPDARDHPDEARILVSVERGGRPHVACTRFFASCRGLRCEVRWEDDPATARELLADGSVDAAVLDSHLGGHGLLEELAERGPRVPVILFSDAAPATAGRLPFRVVPLPRDRIEPGTMREAFMSVLPEYADAWRAARHGSAAVIDFPAHEPGEPAPAGLAAAEPSLDLELLQHLPVIVGRISREGILIEVAGAGLERIGMQRESLLGRCFAEAFPDGGEALQRAATGENAHFERCLGDGDGRLRCIRFDLFPDEREGGAIGLLAQHTPEAPAHDAVIRAVETERQRIGADLHDEVGQLLTGITCLSSALVARLEGRDDLAAEDAAAIAHTAKDALAQLRSLAHGLAPVQITRQGLGPALREMAGLLHRMHGVDLHLDIPPGRIDIDPETATHLFRIVQEATANAVRHGRATAIHVSVRRVHEGHTLTVQDNGCGFDINAPGQGCGSGLRLMEYRAALICGRLVCSSRRGAGTRLELTFPSIAPRSHETAC